MSDMLHSFVKKEIKKQIQEEYPYLQHPSGMYAEVVQAGENRGKFSYTIRLLDEAMNRDNDFPEIPNVETDLELKKGDIVAVLFLYGGSAVFILGRQRA